MGRADARARLRLMSAHRGADAILRLHCVPHDVALDDFSIVFYILHRLGMRRTVSTHH